jgi:hypothetical protein
MKSKRFFTPILAAACFFVGTPALGFETLVPLLVDIGGYQADEAQGANVNMGGMEMVTASRTYSKGEKSIDAVIMIGPRIMTEARMQEFSVETQEGKATGKEIDGFTVHLSYDKENKSSAAIVFLAQNEAKGAMFAVTVDGGNEKEALDISKKFNWSKLKKAAEKLM